MREGSIYRTKDDDGAPRALPGLECMACGRVEPDSAHIAEALAEGVQASPWIRLQLEVAVAGSTRAHARLPFTIPTGGPPVKNASFDWPGVRRHVLN
jgi:hypothetical protein